MKLPTLKLSLAALMVLAVYITACTKPDDGPAKDETYPTIDLTPSDAFPVNCSVVQRGQTFTAKIHVSDNQELGALSVDIHHNFDHHTHSTETGDCDPAPDKNPVNPLNEKLSIEIPAGQKDYIATKDISLPADIDTGDYHFLIRLTDRTGWQTIKGLSIKIK